MYTTYITYLLRNGKDVEQSVLDKHQCGLFSILDWVKIMGEVGFKAKVLPFNHSEFKDEVHLLFIGVKLINEIINKRKSHYLF